MKISKHTKVALSGLDWAIAQTIDAPRQPDEFTRGDYIEKTGVSKSTASDKLLALIEAGTLTCRKATISGKASNLYRRKS